MRWHSWGGTGGSTLLHQWNGAIFAWCQWGNSAYCSYFSTTPNGAVFWGKGHACTGEESTAQACGCGGAMLLCAVTWSWLPFVLVATVLMLFLACCMWGNCYTNGRWPIRLWHCNSSRGPGLSHQGQTQPRLCPWQVDACCPQCWCFLPPGVTPSMTQCSILECSEHYSGWLGQHCSPLRLGRLRQAGSRASVGGATPAPVIPQNLHTAPTASCYWENCYSYPYLTVGLQLPSQLADLWQFRSSLFSLPFSISSKSHCMHGESCFPTPLLYWNPHISRAWESWEGKHNFIWV